MMAHWAENMIPYYQVFDPGSDHEVDEDRDELQLNK